MKFAWKPFSCLNFLFWKWPFLILQKFLLLLQIKFDLVLPIFLFSFKIIYLLTHLLSIGDGICNRLFSSSSSISHFLIQHSHLFRVRFYLSTSHIPRFLRFLIFLLFLLSFCSENVYSSFPTRYLRSLRVVYDANMDVQLQPR